jgi:tetratricopeptide (TPR) repeat protein
MGEATLNTLDVDQNKLMTIGRASILALASSFILVSCLFAKTSQRQEISDLPGAVIYSNGKSTVSEIYQDAVNLFEERKFEEAESLYRQIIEVETDNPNGFIGLGGSLLYQDRLEEAEQAYLEALDLSPQSVGAMIGLGSVRYLKGRYLEADELYSQVLELDRDVADAHWGRAIALEQLGKVEDAIFHLERFIELAADSQLVGNANLRIEELKATEAGED